MQTERLSTLDEFGGRKFVIPAEVSGPLRRLRSRVYTGLLFLFLALPWLKINGLQAVWFDIPHRHFEIFGVLFLAHDAPLIFLILGFLVLSLAFVTVVWGRVWCGWACPQTVFIDALYRRIEIWIEGDYIQRRRLRQEELSFKGLFKVTLKWLAYFLISSIIAHSFIAYFAGSDNLLKMLHGTPEDNWTYFVIVTSVTALLMFNFGWFREQFCTIMCPYGRFQSVLLDSDSVTVAYDQARGEPRKGLANPSGTKGDCVSCNRCVQVCPTAIDIRNGIQMECIGCTACIDACNEIMAKVKKAPNLIGYRSLSGRPFRITRPRPLAALSLACVCILVLSIAITRRNPFSVTLLRASDTPYQILPDGRVLNHFKIHFLNQSQMNEEFTVTLPAALADQGIQLNQNNSNVLLNVGEAAEAHFFLIFPRKLVGLTGDRKLQILVREIQSQAENAYEVTLVGPQ